MAASPPVRTSRQQGAEETRQKLLQVALELFSSSPYELVKISAVAESAGVAHGVVFHHFGSKRGCYLSAMREAGRMLDEAIAPSAKGTFRRRFHGAMVRLLEFMASHESLALQLILNSGAGDGDVSAIFDESRRSRLAWIASEVGLDVGNAAVSQALYAWVGTVDHGTTHWLRTGGATRVNDLARFFFETLVATVEGIPLLNGSVDVGIARERLAAR